MTFNEIIEAFEDYPDETELKDAINGLCYGAKFIRQTLGRDDVIAEIFSSIVEMIKYDRRSRWDENDEDEVVDWFYKNYRLMEHKYIAKGPFQ